MIKDMKFWSQEAQYITNTVKTKQKQNPDLNHLWKTANIVLSGERLKVFPLRPETVQECPVSQVLFNTVLEVLAKIIRQGKKSIQMERSKTLPIHK